MKLAILDGTLKEGFTTGGTSASSEVLATNVELCGCPNVETGVLEQLGALLILADSGLAYLSSLLTDTAEAVTMAFEEEAEEALVIEAVLYFADLEPVHFF